MSIIITIKNKQNRRIGNKEKIEIPKKYKNRKEEYAKTFIELMFGEKIKKELEIKNGTKILFFDNRKVFYKF